MSSDWSQLPPELTDQITARLALPDLIRFGYVCTTWKSRSTPVRHKGRLPWLIIPFKNSIPKKASIWINSPPFYSILDNKYYKVNLPEIIDRRICGASNGWLMTIHENGDIQLLHPFTRKVIDIPSLLDMPEVFRMNRSDGGTLQYLVHYLKMTTWEDATLIRDTYIKKAIIVSTPQHVEVVVCIVYTRLFFCMPEKDDEWNYVRNSDSEKLGITGYIDVTYCRGKLYTVIFDGSLFVVEGLEGPTPVTKMLICDEGYHYGCGELNLVESSGELLKIKAIRDERKTTLSFKVSELDFEECKWVEVNDLGHHAIFLGFNYSFSLSTSDFPSCVRNCIYFTDPSVVENRGGYDLHIYNLEDGTIETIFLDDSASVWEEPIWYASMQGNR